MSSLIEALFQYNCSSLFLIYGLGLKVEDLSRLGFINAYLKDKDKEIFIETPVFLLFKPTNMEEFEQFLRNEYSRTIAIIEDYDYEGGYIVALYKFPDKWKNDYKLFIEGKYSKFSSEFKKLMPIKGRGIHKDYPSIQNRIIEKSKEFKEVLEDFFDSTFDRDDEYWQIPNEEKETLNIENIRKI